MSTKLTDRELRERGESVFGSSRQAEPELNVEDLNLEHAVALELAEDICTKNAGEMMLEMGGKAERLVSEPFRYGLREDATVRIGLVYRMNTYFDNATQEPVEEVQILHVKDIGNGEELHTVVGTIRHNLVTAVQTEDDKEALNSVMDCIATAQKALRG